MDFFDVTYGLNKFRPVFFFFCPKYILNVDLEEGGDFHCYLRYWSTLSIQNKESTCPEILRHFNNFKFKLKIGNASLMLESEGDTIE